MSKALTVSLTDEQHTFLRSLTTSGRSPARVQTRARILLLTDRSQGERLTDKNIAIALRVSLPTIGKTRRRFAQAQAAGPLQRSCLQTLGQQIGHPAHEPSNVALP